MSIVPSSRVMGRNREPIKIEDFYALKIGSIWRHFKQEHFSFWMICAYLFVEYVRPQSIIESLDVLPWAQLFLLLALVGRMADKKAKWVSDPANLWITGFLLVIILASLTAIYPSISWKHFKDFFSWYVIYFLIINIVTTEKRFLIFLGIFLISSYKLSISCARIWAMRGFSFTTWGLMGPPGFFQNSGELSVQMLMFSPVATRLALFMKPYLTKLKFYAMLFGPITGAMTVMGASSRGSQISLVYQVYRTLIKDRISFKRLLIIAVVIYAGVTLLPQEQKERFSSAGSDNTSQQRLLYWKHGIEMIKQYPVLGVGYFNFPEYYEVHYPQDMLFSHAQLPHNIFIQVGTDSGFIGLFFFAMLIYRTIAGTRQIKAMARAAPEGSDAKPFLVIADGLAIAMWGYLIAGQFVTITYYPFFWINLALVVSLRNVAQQHYRPSANKSGLRSTESKSADLGAAETRAVRVEE